MPSKFKEGERKQDAAPESEVVAEAWNRFATARTRSVAEERILVRLQQTGVRSQHVDRPPTLRPSYGLPPTSTYLYPEVKCSRQTDLCATRECKGTARRNDRKLRTMRRCSCSLLGTKCRTAQAARPKPLDLTQCVQHHTFPLRTGQD